MFELLTILSRLVVNIKAFVNLVLLKSGPRIISF